MNMFKIKYSIEQKKAPNLQNFMTLSRLSKSEIKLLYTFQEQVFPYLQSCQTV